MRRQLPLVALASLLLVPPARAATITVDTNTDTLGPGVCSLREAIDSANGSGPIGACAAGGGTDLVVVPARRYTLSIAGTSENANQTGDLDVNTPMTIMGAGPGNTTIDGGGIDRVIGVNAGAGSVQIQDLGITGGHAPDGPVGATVIAPSGNYGSGENGGDAMLGRGGGIANQATLTLLRTKVYGNHAGAGGPGGNGSGGGGTSGPGFNGFGGSGGKGAAGGGIANLPGATLTVTDSTLSMNGAGAGGDGSGGFGGASISPTASGGNGSGGGGGTGGSGGAIDNEGSLVIGGSTFADDHVGDGGQGGAAGGGMGTPAGFGDAGPGGPPGDGGAIVTSTPISITSSTFSGNGAGSGGQGGDGVGGDSNSGGARGGGDGGNGGYLSGNGDGGAVYSTSTGSIVNATFTGNSAGSGGAAGTGFGGTTLAGMPGGGGNGGAVAASSLSLRHATIAGNHAGAGGGAGSAPGGGSGLDSTAGGAIDVQNSVIAGDTCIHGDQNGAGTIISAGSGCLGTVGDAQLGPLADNGGPTETMAIGAGSAARDLAPADATCPATDQRGVIRPAGPACDAGAFELAPPGVQTGLDDAASTTGTTIAGTIDAYGLPTSYHFAYGTGAAPDVSTPEGATDGPAAAPVSTVLTGLAPGTTYHFRLVATNRDGASTGETQTFTTAASRSAGPAPDRTAPRLTALRVSPAAFRAGARARIAFRLSERATVSLAVQQRVAGLRLKARRGPARCASRSRANLRTLIGQIKKTLGATRSKGKAGKRRIAAAEKRARCARYVTRGHLRQVIGVSGAGHVAFSGRLGARSLANGRYRIEAVATDAAKNRSPPVHASFVILAPKRKPKHKPHR